MLSANAIRHVAERQRNSCHVPGTQVYAAGELGRQHRKFLSMSQRTRGWNLLHTPRFINVRSAWIAIMLLCPVGAAAQTTSIAGRVTDTSAAVLPGVTVEVSSPALIEKIRSVTSDGEGLYKI